MQFGICDGGKKNSLSEQFQYVEQSNENSTSVMESGFHD